MNEAQARLTDIGEIRQYVLGGSATVTLVSAKTLTRYTYKLSLKKGSKDFFFVALLTGPDNQEDYRPCGTLRQQWRNTDLIYSVKRAPRYEWTHGAPSITGFRWFVKQLNRGEGEINPQVEVWTSGRCSRCSRILTVPESVALGIGPVCRDKAAV
jgi:hypothetical protein